MATAASKKTTAKVNTTVPSRRAQLTPQASADPVAAGAAAVQKGPLSQDEAIAEAKEAGDDIVNVSVPHAFRLTTDDHRETQYTATTVKMPRSHAEHEYAKANGVRVIE